MPSIAVVGGSRGIGLEFVRQLSEKADNIVYVIVRSKARSTELFDLAQSTKNMHVFEADVADTASMKNAAADISEVSSGSLDILIHNAARTEPDNAYKSLVSYDSDTQLDEEFIAAFKVNVLGVIHSVNGFLPLLRKGTSKKIIVLGTSGGEREIVQALRINMMAAYGTTKASTHMVVTKYAIELDPEGFTVVVLCPGLVATNSVKHNEVDRDESLRNFPEGTTNFLAVDFAVQQLLDRIYKVGPADTGKFFSLFPRPESK